jgi:hypothetical protein
MYPRLPVPTAVPPRGGEGERVADFNEPCITWRKSTVCDTSACVEVAVVDRWVLIRDSVNPGQALLTLSPTAWSAFLRRARTEDLDLRRA